jgi:branched-chain amino acid transport system substrate-binding protein
VKRICLAALAVASLLAACGDDDDTATDSTSSASATGAAGAPGAPGAATGEPIVLGAAIAQSGLLELYDTELVRGIRYAIDEVNAAGGAGGRPMALVVADHGTDIARVASATEDVLDQGADVVVTTSDYDFGAPAALEATEAGVVSIGGAGAPEYGREGLGPLSFNVYQATPTEAAVLAEWGYAHGWRKPYLFVDTSFEYTKSVCALFEEAWTALAGPDSIAGTSTFLNSDPSIASQVTAVKGTTDADVAVMCSYPPGGASAIRQLRTGGVDLPILGAAPFDGTYWLEAVPDLSDFYHASMASSAGDDPNPAVNAFLAAAKPAGGGVYVLVGYEIVETIKRGVEKAGTTEGVALAHAIETFTDEPFLVGPTSYTADCHIPLGRPMAIQQIQAGVASHVEYVTPKALPASPC